MDRKGAGGTTAGQQARYELERRRTMDLTLPLGRPCKNGQGPSLKSHYGNKLIQTHRYAADIQGHQSCQLSATSVNFYAANCSTLAILTGRITLYSFQ